MFATLQQPVQPIQLSNPSTSWIPTRPSPLSPRGQFSSFTTEMTTPRQQAQPHPSSLFTFSPRTPTTTVSQSQSPSPSHPRTEPTNPNPKEEQEQQQQPREKETYAHRYKTTIANPLSQLSRSRTRTYTPGASSISPTAQKIRRNAFLNRIRQDRDNGRFESRGEQLLFMENIAEQREWVEAMRRRAEEIGVGLCVEDLDDMDDHFEVVDDEAEMQALELDEYLRGERALEMEIIERVEGGGEGSRDWDGNGGLTSSFSDEEYDGIFMDLADGSCSSSQDVNMDMSLG